MKEKVPSAFVFVSTDAFVAFFSNKTAAPGTTDPDWSWTVPETVITGRGWLAGTWAKAVADATDTNISVTAAARKQRALAPFIRKKLIGGILLTRGHLARMGFGGDTPGFCIDVKRSGKRDL